MTASLLGAGFEGFVLDEGMLASVYRVLRGIKLCDEMLGLDAICQAVPGEEHFMGAAETHGAMERDYVYPRIADLDPPLTWAAAGHRPPVTAPGASRGRSSPNIALFI